MMIDEKDKALLALLSKNSRESIAKLARKLALSRSTVKGRIARLESRGIISGYTLRFNKNYESSQIQAHVMVSSDSKLSAGIAISMRNMPAIKSLHAVSGIYDMLVVVSTESTKALDQVLDEIGALKGIEKTVSFIILSTKFER